MIKEDKEILDLFVKYSSLRYFKNYLEEDLIYLRNFDLDDKDVKNIVKRINDVKKIIGFLETHNKL